MAIPKTHFRFRMGDVPDTFVVTGQCVFTGKEHSIDGVPIKGFQRWETGEACIQDAMPELSAEDREFLISGISPEGWKETFG